MIVALASAGDIRTWLITTGQAWYFSWQQVMLTSTFGIISFFQQKGVDRVMVPFRCSRWRQVFTVSEDSTASNGERQPAKHREGQDGKAVEVVSERHSGPGPEVSLSKWRSACYGTGRASQWSWPLERDEGPDCRRKSATPRVRGRKVAMLRRVFERLDKADDLASSAEDELNLFVSKTADPDEAMSPKIHVPIRVYGEDF